MNYTITAYVVYFPEEQRFLSGTSRVSRLDPSFGGARVFRKEGHANNCIATGKHSAVVIPVSLTLDPKNLFTAILKGKPKTESSV